MDIKKASRQIINELLSSAPWGCFVDTGIEQVIVTESNVKDVFSDAPSNSIGDVIEFFVKRGYGLFCIAQYDIESDDDVDDMPRVVTKKYGFHDVKIVPLSVSLTRERKVFRYILFRNGGAMRVLKSVSFRTTDKNYWTLATVFTTFCLVGPSATLNAAWLVRKTDKMSVYRIISLNHPKPNPKTIGKIVRRIAQLAVDGEFMVAGTVTGVRSPGDDPLKLSEAFKLNSDDVSINVMSGNNFLSYTIRGKEK